MKPVIPLVTAIQAWIEVFMRHSMQDFLCFAKAQELSMSQIGALFHLVHQGGCGVSDLGEQIGVTCAGASQLVDRLVHQGLIQRVEAAHDRRCKQIALTERGRTLLQEGIRARASWLEALAQALSPEEQEQVLAAFHPLIQKGSALEE